MHPWLDRCHFGDCVETMRRMPAGIANTCITSPPYYAQRDYGQPGQIGLEATPAEYVAKMVLVFREVHRVLRDDGTLWLNLGDSYGKNNKQLLGIPWRVALALQDDGWVLRQCIVWDKPNAMPEKATDRCTNAHEFIFLLSKGTTYYFDQEAMREPVAQSSLARPSGQVIPNQASFEPVAAEAEAEAEPAPTVRARGGKNALRGQGHFSKGGTVPVNRPGREMKTVGSDALTRNKRSVWSVATRPYEGAHLATYPAELIEPCVLAGAQVGGVVLDPFLGSGTTAEVAQNFGRSFIGCELDPGCEPLQARRLRQPALLLEPA